MKVISEEKLNALGLPIMQAKVYIASLQLGQASIQSIARKSGVSRSTIYTFIDEMIAKHYLFETVQGKRKLYSAASPERILEDEASRFKKLQNLLPELQALNNNIKRKPRVTYYEGMEGIKEVYQDMINEKDNIFAYEDLKHLKEGLPKSIFKWFPGERAKHGIHISSISRDSKEARKFSQKNQKLLRTTRFIEDEDFKTDINIYGNKIALMDLRSDMPFCVLIENKHLADTLKMLWKQLWNRL